MEAGASAKLVGCAGSHNGKSAFEVTGGSCMTADRCTSTADAQGGVLVDGVATNATVENTKVSRSLASGMHIQVRHSPCFDPAFVFKVRNTLQCMS